MVSAGFRSQAGKVMVIIARLARVKETVLLVMQYAISKKT